MKNLFIIILIACFSIAAESQTMATIFKMLPHDCTTDLNAKQKNILLRNKEYTLPGGDADETIQYELQLNEAANYLRYNFYYTTGQSGFNSFEIKKFIRNDGTLLVVFSRYGGTKHNASQFELRCFNFRENKLVEFKQQLLPADIDIKEFLKPGTPDSIKTKLAGYISSSYELNSEKKDTIEFRIYFESPVDDYQSYISGEAILFTWTGKLFKRHLSSSE